MLLVAVGAAAYTLYTDRRDFARTFERIGAGPVILSLAFGLAGVGATYPMWREMLKGLGVTLPWGDGARLFFITQLGKYLPGSIWPALMQMEAGRRRGATRITMLWANLSSLILNCGVGFLVATVLLPVYDRAVFTRYWWALLAVPVIAVSLHPKVLPAVADRVLALLRRPPLDQTIDGRAELRAASWAVASWAALGCQLAVLVVANGHSGFGPIALSIGGMALAVPLGVLFLPAPAGAGVREVILVLVLESVMGYGQALAIVVGSRAILVVCDLALAGGIAITGLRRGSRIRAATEEPG